MPRILSNTRLSYDRRRRSSLSSTTSVSSRRSSVQQLSGLSDWFSVLTGNPSTQMSQGRSPVSSLSSSGSNTPPDSSSRRQIIPRRSSAPELAGGDMFPIPTEDSWGQFVDTAEAEKELVRHSRVLSRKETPGGLSRGANWRLS